MQLKIKIHCCLMFGVQAEAAVSLDFTLRIIVMTITTELA